MTKISHKKPRKKPRPWVGLIDDRPTAVVYETGKVRYRGVYMDGVYTRRMALAIKQEVENILKFFDKTDEALKASMREVKK